MALAARYSFQFFSVKDGEQFDITISQEGYGGAVEPLDFAPGRDFLKLGYDKTNPSILWPVRGSQMTIRLSLTPTQIAEFVLADNRTWFIDVVGDNGFEWHGWLQPQTSATYSPYNLRELELQFSDNLGALQNTPDSVLDEFLIELQPFTEMIERELGYTDIALPTTISTSVRHVDFSPETANDTIHLEQSMSLDYNGQEPQPAYDVLSKMLRMLHCVVYQKGGTWVVENFIDKYLSAYPTDLLDTFSVVGRSMNIRFESPLSKTTGKSYHYQVRHTQKNRDFADYIASGPNKGFIFWEQFGSLATEMFSLLTISGKRWLGVLGNYVSTNGNSADDYTNDGGPVTEGEAVRLFINYEPTNGLGFDVLARIAVSISAVGDPYWLQANGTWTQSASAIILVGDDEINGVKNIQTIAPINGNVSISIYRPLVPSAGTTYSPSTNFIRFAYAEVLASKVSEPTDYKMFRSVATKQNKGMREPEIFETIGLQFDSEFSPNGASFFQYEDFVSFIYDSTGNRLDSKFISDYDVEERSITQFATNTFMRLFAKPQIYIEVDLYGKGLNVGDIYTLDIPGFASALTFVVIAFDWDIKNDIYSALLAYIDYDSADAIDQKRYWLQQNQDDLND